jgi:hypothetical protein
MSALLPIADIRGRGWNVRFVPRTDFDRPPTEPSPKRRLIAQFVKNPRSIEERLGPYRRKQANRDLPWDHEHQIARSPDANYLPGPDEIYVSPSQIRRPMGLGLK